MILKIISEFLMRSLVIFALCVKWNQEA